MNAENNTAMPAEFLMKQMSWRESLDEAVSLEEIERIGLQVTKMQRKALEKCEQLIDVDRDFSGAVGQVRALMFIERFASDVDARIEQLESNPH